MSISQIIKPNRWIKRLKIIGEYIYREGKVFNPYKIYFPYKADLVHPVFDELKSKPPIKYLNKKDANLLHLVLGGNKKDLEQSCILEVIDHAFSIIASYEIFPREPIEYYNRREKIKELYLNKNLKKIIFISNGQKDLTRYYFPGEKILEKSVVIAIPWKDNIAIGKKQIENSLNFLFIASNYQAKGVEIALKAWGEFKSMDRTSSTLTLVSHDIPKEVEENLQKDIKLIKQVPLSSELKNKLYKDADVVLALTLTDGIIAVEATSYGKPIITYKTQHQRDFIDNNNGVEIDVPINIYDVDKYGIVWKTSKEFHKIVKEYISNGNFDNVIDELVKSFIKYSEDRNFIEKQTQNAIKKYYKDYTIELRNKKILEIYDEFR